MSHQLKWICYLPTKNQELEVMPEGSSSSWFLFWDSFLANFPYIL